MTDKVKIENDGTQAVIFCPGCRRVHVLRVAGANCWDFNGDRQLPTFDPSLLCKHQRGDVADVCHSFIRSGRIQYLADCTHDLAGKTVELPPFKWHE